MKQIFSRILIVKTESAEVSIADVEEEEVGREFPAEYCQVEEGPGEMRDTSRLLQQSRTNTFRYFHHHHLRYSYPCKVDIYIVFLLRQICVEQSGPKFRVFARSRRREKKFKFIFLIN